MWRRYFKFVKLVPGKVFVPKFGTIDFSRDNLPVDMLKSLYESKFQYLEITPEGIKELYENASDPAIIDALPAKRKKKHKNPG